MAFRMRHWLALVSLLLLGVAAWGLILPPTEVGGRREVSPEFQRHGELSEELFLQTWLYQHLQWRDSLVGEIEKGLARGSSVVVGLPDEAPDSVRARLSLAVELQLADLGLDEPAMPLGVFVIPRSQGAHPDAILQLTRLARGREFYVAREGEASYCIIGVPYDDREEENPPQWYQDPLARQVRLLAEVPTHSRATPNTLGLCRYFVRYGEPGGQMMAWLRTGGSRFAERVFGIDHHLLYGQGPARGPFGKADRDFPPRTLLCLGGIREDCLGILMGPESRSLRIGWITLGSPDFLAESPVDFVEHRGWREDGMLGLASVFFFAMEEDFGSERFGKFWRSPLPPPEAFERAFEKPLDLWVMEWLQRYYDPSPRGPGVPRQSTLLTVLILGILAGGAVRMGRR